MMADSSTPKYPSYDRGGNNGVSPYITLSILVAGVVGGLIIVIAFILFCKYCVKKKTTLRRDQGTDCERSSDRRFKPFQRYETINSDVFSEPSTGSMDGIPVSPRRLLEAKSHEKLAGTEEANETTKLKSDFDKATYNETDLDLESIPADIDQSKPAADATGSAKPEEEKTGRRVSFQLDNMPTNGYLRKGRRYTDGDFHYLKHIRINNKKNVPRQFSLGSHQRFDKEKVAESIEMVPLPPAIEEHAGDTPSEYGEPVHQLHSPIRCFDSPSPAEDDTGPQIVDVEVHHRGVKETSKDLTHKTEIAELPLIGPIAGPAIGPINGISRSPRRSVANALKPTSHSMDVVSPTRATVKTNRRVKSYDDVLEYDYDVLKITEFSRGPFHNNDFDPIIEVQALGSSTVRYNDMGSIEILNEEKLYMFDDFEFESIIPDESDADTETTINGYQKYREIWNLRTTLEEEEECSDTIRMEDSASLDDHSPERDIGGASYSPTYHPTVTNSPNYQGTACHTCKNGKAHPITYGDEVHRHADNSNFLHPNYENRRDSYSKVVSRRYQKRNLNSAENSFDSVETGDTDGDVSDTSRQEITTSFESTTDNTDSTNESQTNRLRQMKADSGYKSLETQQPPCTVNGSSKKSQTTDDDIIVLESSESVAPLKKEEVLEDVGLNESIPRRSSIFEKRKGRTASKRRREYSRERQVVRLYESFHEPETDSTRSDIPSGDSFEEPSPSGTSKFSVFSRFFKSQRSRDKGLSRDFSMDEKTNDIFNEFVRYDPKFDGSQTKGSTAARRFSTTESRRERLQRKFTDPGPSALENGRHWLSPEMRSTSLGSDSSASSARKRSPQDSIEEEEFEDDIDAAVMDHRIRILEQEQTTSTVEVSTPTVSIHEIPIIKLPEGEVVDV